MTKTEHPNTTGAGDKAYRESLEWLYRQSRGGAKRDPARMRALVVALGLEYPPRSVHVVGTNGKGTVTAMCAAAAAAAGWRSAAFTSPHVEEFGERITVDGTAIPPEVVVEFVERIRSRDLPVTPSFFELTLALALEHFARTGVEFGAFEAGVGAERDATAVLERVAAVAVTPIALDHVETLGPSLRDIARDKAAAMRRGLPVASATQQPEVLEVLQEEARRRGCELHVDAPESPLFAPPAGLAAESDPVRRSNQRVAAATMRLLGDVNEAALAEGLGIPPLPGRGERFQVAGITVLLDGAHDPAAGRALSERAGGEYVLLFGSLGRKQGEATLRALEGRSQRAFVTRAGGEPPTVAGSSTRTVIEEPARALLAAIAATPPGGRLVVAGSLYLAGELRPLLRRLAATGSMTGLMTEER
ncbi:MAG TPA: hypothetical protein VF168_11320 [Trueperaceae bacterium]